MARGTFFVYASAARGSRNGPVAGPPSSRSSRSSFKPSPLRCRRALSCRRSPDCLRLQLYVGDPFLQPGAQSHGVTMIWPSWPWCGFLGMPRAFGKARQGLLSKWIVSQISNLSGCSEVTTLASEVEGQERPSALLWSVSLSGSSPLAHIPSPDVPRGCAMSPRRLACQLGTAAAIAAGPAAGAAC